MAKDVNWTAVEADYRAGLKTLRVIGAEHGISAVAVLQHAKKGQWPRDLAPAIKARAEEKLNKAALNSRVNKADEKAIVERNSDLLADLQGTHRAEWKDLKPIVAKAMKEGKFEDARTAKVLAETTMICQTGERRAWGIDKDGGSGTKLSEFLKTFNLPEKYAVNA